MPLLCKSPLVLGLLGRSDRLPSRAPRMVPMLIALRDPCRFQCLGPLLLVYLLEPCIVLLLTQMMLLQICLPQHVDSLLLLPDIRLSPLLGSEWPCLPRGPWLYQSLRQVDSVLLGPA